MLPYSPGSSGEDRVRAWLRLREPLELQLRPLGEAMIARLNLTQGARVLDIGCGVGGTPETLARVVGLNGEVTGIDLLPAAIELLRAEARGDPRFNFIAGDAETYRFPLAYFDAAFSRFGVMFFANLAAAFANIRNVIRPGGRLGFTCWRGFADNELDHFPLRSVAQHLPVDWVAVAASAEHFNFADADFVTSLLTNEGYVDVDIQAHDNAVGSGDHHAMAEVCASFGSLGRILRDRPEPMPDVIPILMRALEARLGGAAPTLIPGIWTVTATVPT